MRKRQASFVLAGIGVSALSLLFGVVVQTDAGHLRKLSFFSQEVPFAFHYYLLDVKNVPAANSGSNALSLPDSLIIESGTYSVYNVTYDLHDEGLYRFFNPPHENQQRIVYDGKDEDALLSAIAWIYSHGNADDSLNHHELTKKAMTSKIFSTCGVISSWLKETLASRGIDARLAQTLTLDNWNNYDNGHTLVEVYNKKYGQWVLYDLDNNAYFLHNGHPLSLVAFSVLSSSDDYEIGRLARDARIDISGFGEDGYSYGFYSESVFANDETQKEWYKRVMQVPMLGASEIGGASYRPTFYHFDEENQERIRSYSPSYGYLDRDAFMEKFYP